MGSPARVRNFQFGVSDGYHGEPVDQGLQVPGMRIIVQRVVRKDIRSAGSCSAAPSASAAMFSAWAGMEMAVRWQAQYSDRLHPPFLLPWCGARKFLALGVAAAVVYSIKEQLNFVLGPRHAAPVAAAAASMMMAPAAFANEIGDASKKLGDASYNFAKEVDWNNGIFLQAPGSSSL